MWSIRCIIQIEKKHKELISQIHNKEFLFGFKITCSGLVKAPSTCMTLSYSTSHMHSGTHELFPNANVIDRFCSPTTCAVFIPTVPLCH